MAYLFSPVRTWRDVGLTLLLGLIPVTVLELAKLAARIGGRRGLGRHDAMPTRS